MHMRSPTLQGQALRVVQADIGSSRRPPPQEVSPPALAHLKCQHDCRRHDLNTVPLSSELIKSSHGLSDILEHHQTSYVRAVGANLEPPSQAKGEVNRGKGMAHGFAIRLSSFKFQVNGTNTQED